MDMVGQAAAAAPAAREGTGEEASARGTAGVPARAEVTARAADAETLCPAAVIIARAVEAVLSGSTSVFGGDDGSAAASEVVTPVPEGARVVGVVGEKSEGFVADGGEGSQEERDRYREILEGLGRRHAALGKAIDSAVESSWAPTASVDEAAADEASAALKVDAKVLPPVSQWQFKCSSGGAVETEADNAEENGQENECLQQVRGLPRVSALSIVEADTYDAAAPLVPRERTSRRDLTKRKVCTEPVSKACPFGRTHCPSLLPVDSPDTPPFGEVHCFLASDNAVENSSVLSCV